MTPLATLLTAAIEFCDRPNVPYEAAMERLLAESPVPVLTPEEQAEITTHRDTPRTERDPLQTKRVVGLINRASDHIGTLERRAAALPVVAAVVAEKARVRDYALAAYREAAASRAPDAHDARGLPVTPESALAGTWSESCAAGRYGVRAAIPGGGPCPWCGSRMVYPRWPECHAPAFCEDDDTHVVEWLPWGG